MVDQLSDIKGLRMPYVNEDYFKGSKYGFKAKIVLEDLGYESSVENIKKVVASLKAENVEIKLPDTFPLDQDPIFNSVNNLMTKGTQEVILKGDYKGAKEYMRGRVSLPTFSGGKKDYPIIKEYRNAFIKVFDALEQILK